MLTEVIYFLNELDLLEAHLDQHSKFGWPMYVVECAKTISGVRKPLYFGEHKSRFERFDVKHIIIPEEVFGEISGSIENQYKQFRDNDWRKRLWIQENFECKTEWLFHSDVDEILNKKPEITNDVDYLCFILNQYMSQVNRRVAKKQDAYRLVRSSLTLNQLKNPRLVRRRALGDMGWHFTNCPSSAEEMRLKAQCRPWYFKALEPESVPPVEYFRSLMNKPINYMTGQPLGMNWIVDFKELPQFMTDNIALFPIA